jgi:hypothetical protein
MLISVEARSLSVQYGFEATRIVAGAALLPRFAPRQVLNYPA